MGLFDRKISKAAISPAPVKAAAAGGFAPGYSSSNVGVNMIGQYYTYREGELRAAAVSIPALSRSRDLLASVIGCMPLRMYNEVWNADEEEMERKYIAPRSWLRRPDPTVNYNFLMSWTFDDLYFFGRAFWYITSRTADGYPASFTRLPAGSVTTTDQAGPVWFAPSSQVYFQGGEIDPANLVQFLSPTQGMVYSSQAAIETALKIQEARNRNASSSIPAGVLKQTGGEPLSAQELADLAAAFNAARATNQTAALNEYLSYEPTTMSPDKMLLIESANYSALETGGRIGNVPPYLLGISTGSYAYSSSQNARMDLLFFGVKLYADAIAETLSMNNVLPNGTFVAFDYESYLEENYLADTMENTQTVIEDNSPEEMPS
jgi:phage portal protein BeeE